jgi:hypothetical protein
VKKRWRVIAYRPASEYEYVFGRYRLWLVAKIVEFFFDVANSPGAVAIVEPIKERR